MPPITIFGLDKVNYSKNRDKLISLYTLSFTEGKYAQHIPPEAIEKSLDDIMRIGFGFMAFKKEKLVGAIICLSLKNDPDFPFHAHKNVEPEKTLYIADLMVDQDYRGKGTAKGLLTHLLDMGQLNSYNSAVIRVWDKNIPAVSLYNKMGFKAIDTISQIKLNKETKKPFEMNKVYMFKELV